MQVLQVLSNLLSNKVSDDSFLRTIVGIGGQRAESATSQWEFDITMEYKRCFHARVVPTDECTKWLWPIDFNTALYPHSERCGLALLLCLHRVYLTPAIAAHITFIIISGEPNITSIGTIWFKNTSPCLDGSSSHEDLFNYRKAYLFTWKHKQTHL